MGIVFRQSVKTSIVILSGAILGAMYTYWQARVMPKAEIGVTRNIIVQAAVLQYLLLLGGPSVIYAYLQRYHDKDPRKGVVFGTVLAIPLVSWIIFCIPYFLLKEWVVSMYQPFDQPYVRHFYVWLPVLTLLWSYMTILEFYLISRMKAAMATFMREVVLRLANMVLLALFAFNLVSFDFFVTGIVLSYVIPVVILGLISIKETHVRLSFNWHIFPKKEVREIISYAWYHLLIGLALNLILFLDLLMLAPLSKDGASTLAVYSIATLLISFVSIPYRAMAAAAFPKLNEAYIENRQEHLLHLFNRANLNIIVSTAFVGVLIMCNLDNLIVFLPAGYESLVPLFMILFLGKLIDVSTGLNHEMISITPQYRFIFRAALVYIFIAVVGNRIFIPRYGIFAAAWVSAFGMAVYNIIKAVFLKRKFGLYPFPKHGLWIFPISLFSYGISLAIPNLGNPVLDFCIRTPIVAIVMFVLILWLKPSEDVKHYWETIKERKRLF